MIPVVRFRNPFAPHEALLNIDVAQCAYGFMRNRPQSASFKISRANSNLDNYGHLIAAGAMVSIERSDGYWPWIGYVTEMIDAPDDPYISIVLRDHTFLLEQSRTAWGGSFAGSSGRLIRETLSEINARGEPPLMLDLSQLPDNGPRVTWEYKADKGLSFLQRVQTITGWEWALRPSLSDKRVIVQMVWAERIGADRREAVRWEEGRHIVQVRYGQRASGFVRAALVSGGSGDFAGLVAVQASERPVPDVESFSHGLRRETDVPDSPALRGTLTYHEHQVTDLDSLRAGAVQLLQAPDNAAETLSFSLVESAIDMSQLGIGDIVTVQTQNTARRLRRVVRVIAVQLNPDTEVHSVEVQVLPEQGAA